MYCERKCEFGIVAASREAVVSICFVMNVSLYLIQMVTRIIYQLQFAKTNVESACNIVISIE